MDLLAIERLVEHAYVLLELGDLRLHLLAPVRLVLELPAVHRRPVYSYGRYSYGLYSHGLYSYGCRSTSL